MSPSKKRAAELAAAEAAVADAAAAVKVPFTQKVLEQRTFFLNLPQPPKPWTMNDKPDGTLYYLNTITGEEVLPIKHRISGEIHYVNPKYNVINTLNSNSQPVSQANLASTGQRKRSPSPQQNKLLFKSVPVPAKRTDQFGVFKVGDFNAIEA